MLMFILHSLSRGLLSSLTYMVEPREDENLNKMAVEVASLSLWYLFRLFRVDFSLANVKNNDVL